MEKDNLIGSRLLALRKDRGLTQRKAAFDLKVSAQQLGQWEKGKRQAQLDDLVALARYYHVSADYLLGLSDELSADALDLNQGHPFSFNGKQLSGEDLAIIRKLLKWHEDATK